MAQWVALASIKSVIEFKTANEVRTTVLNLRPLLSGAAISLVLLSTSLGDEVAYNLDLGGVAASGHEVGVTGTIKADTTTNSILETNLIFRHNDERLSLPSLPTVFGPGTGIEWNATPESLMIFRTARSPGEESVLGWEILTNGGRPGFYLGSGTTPHYLLHEVTTPFEFDQVIILDAAAPDANGFLVGMAVPEPRSLTLMLLATAVLLRRRVISR